MSLCAGGNLFHSFAPAALHESDQEDDCPQAFVGGHRPPDADQPHPEMNAEKPCAQHRDTPHADNPEGHRKIDISQCDQTANHHDVDTPPDLQHQLDAQNLSAQRGDCGVRRQKVKDRSGKENKDCGHQNRNRAGDRIGGPHMARNLPTLPAAHQIAQYNLGCL